MTGTAFDKLAERYDQIWSRSAIGHYQRDAVWRVLDPLVRSGDSMLDLGCGTGEDALHFLSRGVYVHGIDASAEMVRVARARGVDAQRLALESLEKLHGSYDCAISNFGTFNCVQRFDRVASALAQLIRPGGFLAICLMSPSCIWEIGYFLGRANPSKAFRRWRPDGCPSAIGIQVYYPSTKRLAHTFRDFKLTQWRGIGLFVPPSFVSELSEPAIAKLAALDRHVAHWPFLRAWSDHRLLLFRRI